MHGARRGVDELVSDIARQRVLLMGHRNVPYHRALEHMNALLEGPHADAELVVKLERCWRDRFFNAYYERPLLLLAAMRHEALTEGPKHPLGRGFASASPDPEAVTRERVRAALAPDRFSLWVTLATRRVQTNETSRAVAWRWPALLAGCDGGARPLALVDIGAAAGLNLIGDRLPASWTTADGAPLRVPSRVHCLVRLGFDTHPLDVRYEEDLNWMRACIWPGETERLARFEAAVLAMRAAYDEDDRPELYTVNAGLVAAKLDAVAKKLPAHALVLAYQTFMHGYLEPERSRTYVRAMKAWLESRPAGSAVWIEMEIAEDATTDAPAEILAHVRGKTLRIARCDYHPSKLLVEEKAAAELAQRLAFRAG